MHLCRLRIHALLGVPEPVVHTRRYQTQLLVRLHELFYRHWKLNMLQYGLWHFFDIQYYRVARLHQDHRNRAVSRRVSQLAAVGSTDRN